MGTARWTRPRDHFPKGGGVPRQLPKVEGHPILALAWCSETLNIWCLGKGLLHFSFLELLLRLSISSRAQQPLGFPVNRLLVACAHFPLIFLFLSDLAEHCRENVNCCGPNINLLVVSGFLSHLKFLLPRGLWSVSRGHHAQTLTPPELHRVPGGGEVSPWTICYWHLFWAAPAAVTKYHSLGPRQQKCIFSQFWGLDV